MDTRQKKKKKEQRIENHLKNNLSGSSVAMTTSSQLTKKDRKTIYTYHTRTADN
jgi:uncharacterized membrane-anchored protein YitT (DUF2179 family)